MKKLSKLLVPLALAISGATASAQGADKGCPHMSVDLVPARLEASNVIPCGSGVSLEFAGLRYTPPQASCALLIIYTPERWRPVARPNSYTYAEYLGGVREHIFRFQCKTVYFLGLIPVDGNCLELPSILGNLLSNYALKRCED